MREGKPGTGSERNRSHRDRGNERYLRSPADGSEGPLQEAKDARRNARERAQLWKHVKAEH
jgi:hypothetical protein